VLSEMPARRAAERNSPTQRSKRCRVSSTGGATGAAATGGAWGVGATIAGGAAQPDSATANHIVSSLKPPTVNRLVVLGCIALILSFMPRRAGSLPKARFLPCQVMARRDEIC